MLKINDIFGLKNSNFSLELLEENNFQKDAWDIQTQTRRVEGGYEIRREIKNISQKTLNFYGFRSVLEGIDLGGNAEEDYFYCTENARIFNQLTIPLDYNRLDDNAKENEKFSLTINRKYCDPGVQAGRICSSTYQPLPAILLSNYGIKEGIVCGSLSQDVFYHSFEVGHKNGLAYLEIYSLFKDIAYREVKPAETLTDILYIGETKNADDINGLFDSYVNVLRTYLTDNEGSKSTNRHTLIWDSWNDGIWRDVSEEMLVNEAKAVKRLFPTVEWFQLDDGYSSFKEEIVPLVVAHGIGVPYEGDEGIDYEKFPNGMKGYTDKIKEVGLKPAVWIGAWVQTKARLYQEHPEWFLPYQYRIDLSMPQPLDVSQEEVRDYMTHALDVFITEYGFEGVKHDFWPYAFEDRHDLLKNKDKSGYEYREWWYKQMRSRLPKDGYLEVAVDFGSGNPFLGKYINNYRLGLDVGAGDWEERKTTVFWSVATLSTHTGDLYIPNSDSVGLLPGLSETDFEFTLNWQIITRTLVEISGKFSLVDENNSRLKKLQRAVQYLNNGENVYFAKFNYRRKGMLVPEIIYINSAFDCADEGYITVALFNAEETEKEIAFAPADVNLPEGEYEVENVWRNEKERRRNFAYLLQPHQSVLLKIKK
ncbi:MAG: hypothetical protein E7381_05390 [Clostridiales bacterium]|nr:hypothetical protein [Clostridiales bacterium]